MKAFFITIIILFFCSSSYASKSSGKVKFINISNVNDRILFQLDNEPIKSPRCNETKQYVLDLTRANSKILYQALLLARQNDWVIDVVGLNTCSVHFKSEDVKNIVILESGE